MFDAWLALCNEVWRRPKSTREVPCLQAGHLRSADQLHVRKAPTSLSAAAICADVLTHCAAQRRARVVIQGHGVSRPPDRGSPMSRGGSELGQNFVQPCSPIEQHRSVFEGLGSGRVSNQESGDMRVLFCESTQSRRVLRSQDSRGFHLDRCEERGPAVHEQINLRGVFGTPVREFHVEIEL